MHSTMSIAPNPIIMENNVFSHKIGLSLTRSVLKRSSGNSNNTLGGTARCLFGVPDPKPAKDVVREVELKNALNFGKRYNFDIVNGEPFPFAKRRKVSHPEDSDEENRVGIHQIGDLESVENEGYIWTETYNQDQMATCNKQANLVPNRYSTVSLLCAITVHVNQVFSPSSSSSTASSDNLYSSNQTEEFQENSPSSQSEISNTCTAIIPSPLNLVSSNETNNNTIINKNNNKSQSNTNTTIITEKRRNRINSNSYQSHKKTHQSLAKKSSLSIAHHILTKYANRVVRHAVRKPRKSIITDYLHLKRTAKTNHQSGKKH